MKKLSLVLLSSVLSSAIYAAPQSSSIELKGVGEVKPAGTLELALDPLLKGVHYEITCQIDNPDSQAVDMRFDPKLSAHDFYGTVTLNNNLLDNNQGSVLSGANTLEFSEFALAEANQKTAVLQFKNLDFGHTVEVKSCIAKPTIRVKPKPLNIGSFVAYNDTNYFVELRVGDFFPTAYLLYPQGSRWIYVSTRNQNIAISDIY